MGPTSGQMGGLCQGRPHLSIPFPAGSGPQDRQECSGKPAGCPFSLVGCPCPCPELRTSPRRLIGTKGRTYPCPPHHLCYALRERIGQRSASTCLPAPLWESPQRDCSGPPSDQLWTELLSILSCLPAPLLTSTPRLPLGVLLLRPYSLCMTSGGPGFPESRPGILVGYLGIYNLQTTCPDGVPTPVAMLLASEESECIPLFGCSVWCPVPVACPVPSAGHHTGTCLQTQRPPL